MNAGIYIFKHFIRNFVEITNCSGFFYQQYKTHKKSRTSCLPQNEKGTVYFAQLLTEKELFLSTPHLIRENFKLGIQLCQKDVDSRKESQIDFDLKEAAKKLFYLTSKQEV